MSMTSTRAAAFAASIAADSPARPAPTMMMSASVCVGALGSDISENAGSFRAIAASQGTMNNVLMGDQSFGYYLNGGVFWRLGKRFNIGLDLRYLGGAEVTVLDVDFSPNYMQAGLILGFGW